MGGGRLVCPYRTQLELLLASHPPTFWALDEVLPPDEEGLIIARDFLLHNQDSRTWILCYCRAWKFEPTLLPTTFRSHDQCLRQRSDCVIHK